MIFVFPELMKREKLASTGSHSMQRICKLDGILQRVVIIRYNRNSWENFFSFMMAGLPAAAYAMYTCAKPENKKAVGGLLVSAALTSLLTGITEPIEFTFLRID